MGNFETRKRRLREQDSRGHDANPRLRATERSPCTPAGVQWGHAAPSIAFIVLSRDLTRSSGLLTERTEYSWPRHRTGQHRPADARVCPEIGLVVSILSVGPESMASLAVRGIGGRRECTPPFLGNRTTHGGACSEGR